MHCTRSRNTSQSGVDRLIAAHTAARLYGVATNDIQIRSLCTSVLTQASQHRLQIGRAIEKPGVNADGLSLVWEAMGAQVVNSCRQHYASRNPSAAFYSARAGLRLADESAGDVLTQIARTTGSKFQIPAIGELGKHPRFYRSRTVLRSLIDDESDLTRIAAYEALVALGDTALIRRTRIGEFDVDLVKSSRSYVIYAAQSGQERLTLFGSDMQVANRVFFDMPDPFNAALGMVTIADKMVDVDTEGKQVDLAKLTPTERANVKTTRQLRLMAFRSLALWPCSFLASLRTSTSFL